MTENEYALLKEKILEDIDFIGEISDKMLHIPRVWGLSERVHLSEAAAMCNTVFNTSSGEIYVGDNTFTGTNVSIITGSHDATKTKEERMKFPIEGNDIHIGNGVWICSNAVILGPCVIEDDACIGAGAVVLPGTHIKKGELWAGVPATLKKNIL